MFPRAALTVPALIVGLLLGGPAPAGAQAPPAAPAVTKKVTVPGTVVFRNGQRADKPGNCSAITFVEWKAVPGAVRATAYYLWKGAETSEARDAPFDNTYEWVVTYTVEPGKDWIAIGKSWGDGPRPNDCSDMLERTRGLYPNVQARVEVTVDNTVKCNAARTRLIKAQTGLKKARARLKKAKSANGKRRERASVKKHQAKVKKAQATQRTECTSS
jgi:hypothetical protein